ncbi:hypothetical protein MERGE_002742 [Pneumocystis wakefieldiae]|uniref:Uncharacterized protein n=1 Tax=Pneumocystis wakefieldiae TaxID=38082 RepID=A0A899FUH2_9ASCO|nr:hypothetical protein MERGE_002742 [Pneumocystis wakefieldiae]
MNGLIVIEHMGTREFASNNPFRLISTSSSITEYKNVSHMATTVIAKPKSQHTTSRTASQWERKPFHHSKQDVKTIIPSNERTHRSHKFFPFSKEKEQEKAILKENSKEKTNDHPRKERRSRIHVDRIDLLDVTAVYGSGAFHHDGPFDACNPYRNKSSKKDPVLAFHEDSMSMSFSKMDAENSKFSIDKYFGNRDVEAYNEFSPSAFYSRKNRSSDLHHGSARSGLGTSTFLEGTHASQASIRRVALLSDEEKNEKDNKLSGFQGHCSTHDNDLNCKRSFAHRIRGSKKDSHSNFLSTYSMDSSYLSETSGQIDVEKTTFSTKKKNISIPQNNFQTISSDNSESSCASKGLLNRVRSLKVGGSRDNHSENQ